MSTLCTGFTAGSQGDQGIRRVVIGDCMKDSPLSPFYQNSLLLQLLGQLPLTWGRESENQRCFGGQCSWWYIDKTRLIKHFFLIFFKKMQICTCVHPQTWKKKNTFQIAAVSLPYSWMNSWLNQYPGRCMISLLKNKEKLRDNSHNCIN